MIYHPHLGEIRPLMDRLCTKWPQLHSRAVKAEQIILNGYIVWCGDAWAVRSQSDGRLYVQEGNACPCPDYANSAPMLKKQTFCKHRIALASYLWILRHHLNARRDLQTSPNTYPVLVDGRHTPVCRVAIDPDGGYKFASPVSAHAFSRWLYKQPVIQATIQPSQTTISIEYAITAL